MTKISLHLTSAISLKQKMVTDTSLPVITTCDLLKASNLCHAPWKKIHTKYSLFDNVNRGYTERKGAAEKNLSYSNVRYFTNPCDFTPSALSNWRNSPKIMCTPRKTQLHIFHSKLKKHYRRMKIGQIGLVHMFS